MSENNEFEWLDTTAKSFGLDEYKDFNQIAGNLVLDAKPGASLNEGLLDFCNTHKKVTDPSYNAQEVQEVVSLIALGIQKAASEGKRVQSEIQFVAEDATGNVQPANSVYNVTEDRLYVTGAMAQSHMDGLKHQRAGGKYHQTRSNHPEENLTAEEAIIFDSYELACYAHHQQSCKEKTGVLMDDGALKAQVTEDGRAFINKMREENYVGQFIAGTEQLFGDVSYAQNRAHSASKG